MGRQQFQNLDMLGFEGESDGRLRSYIEGDTVLGLCSSCVEDTVQGVLNTPSPTILFRLTSIFNAMPLFSVASPALSIG